MGAEKIYLPSLNCGHTATCPPMKQYLNRRAEENIQGGNKHRHQVYSIGKTLSFVRSDVHWFRDFADWNSRSFFFRSSHTGTGYSGTENNNNTFKHQDCEARQESCLINPYEKPGILPGFFFAIASCSLAVLMSTIPFLGLATAICIQSVNPPQWHYLI